MGDAGRATGVGVYCSGTVGDTHLSPVLGRRFLISLSIDECRFVPVSSPRCLFTGNFRNVISRNPRPAALINYRVIPCSPSRSLQEETAAGDERSDECVAPCFPRGPKRRHSGPPASSNGGTPGSPEEAAIRTASTAGNRRHLACEHLAKCKVAGQPPSPLSRAPLVSLVERSSACESALS